MGFLASLGFQGILSLFSTLWPIVSAAIHVAEVANPNPGSGAKKFAQVFDSVSQIATQLPAVINSVQASGKRISDAAHAGDGAALSAGIGDMINLAVKVANSVGAFQKSGFVQGVNERFPPGNCGG